MLLYLHILLALVSLMSVSIAYARSSNKTLRLSYASSIGAVISGIVLTVLHPSYTLKSCILGSAYLAIIIMLIALARTRANKDSIQT